MKAQPLHIYCTFTLKYYLLLGKNKPIILVGNKVDLIPGDSSGWLVHAKKVLLKHFPGQANVMHVALISAKTGFGVEELITHIQSKWQTRGNICLFLISNNVER